MRHSISVVLGIFLFVFISFVATSAFAQPQSQRPRMCGDRTVGIAELRNTYSEEATAMGLGSNGEVIEIFTSKSGTFTIVATRPDGISCVLLSGDSWEDLPVRSAGIES